MNILYVVILLSVICHVYASETSSETSVPGRVSSVADSEGAHEFMDAVERGDLDAVKYTFKDGNDEHKRYYGEYLVGLGRERLVELIKGKDIFGLKAFFLGILLMYAGKELIDEVVKGANLSDRDLSNAVLNTDLACKPDKFVDLLQRMTQRGYQYQAIDRGIYGLFLANKIKHVEPLVYAIESEPSLSQDVKDKAIQKVFYYASLHPSDESASFAKHYHDHPAITADDYSIALCRSYENGGAKKELFYWLLVRADHYDLEAVKSSGILSDQPKEFQDAVNYVLSTLSPEAETRHQRWLRKERERRAARKAAIDEATGRMFPTALLNIMGDY